MNKQKTPVNLTFFTDQDPAGRQNVDPCPTGSGSASLAIIMIWRRKSEIKTWLYSPSIIVIIAIITPRPTFTCSATSLQTWPSVSVLYIRLSLFLSFFLFFLLPLSFYFFPNLFFTYFLILSRCIRISVSNSIYYLSLKSCLICNMCACTKSDKTWDPDSLCLAHRVMITPPSSSRN